MCQGCFNFLTLSPLTGERERTDNSYSLLKALPRSGTHHFCSYPIGGSQSHGPSYPQGGWETCPERRSGMVGTQPGPTQGSSWVDGFKAVCVCMCMCMCMYTRVCACSVLIIRHVQANHPYPLLHCLLRTYCVLITGPSRV